MGHWSITATLALLLGVFCQDALPLCTTTPIYAPGQRDMRVKCLSIAWGNILSVDSFPWCKCFLRITTYYFQLAPNLLVYDMKQALLEELLEIHNSLIEFVLFSCQCTDLWNLDSAVKPSLLQMLFHYTSCFIGANLL